MSFLTEFKKFAVRGNVMDMAVGVIIGELLEKLFQALLMILLCRLLELLQEE